MRRLLPLALGSLAGLILGLAAAVLLCAAGGTGR